MTVSGSSAAGPAARQASPALASLLSAPAATDGASAIDRLVRLAHDHLDMGVVYVAEFAEGRQVFRALAGDAGSFGLHLGDGPGLDGTYCARMVSGDIPNAIPDTSQDSRVADLDITVESGIGAYVGVPLYLPDGQLYGSFCGLSHTAATDLNARDADFMSMLGAFVADELARDKQAHDQHAAISAAIQGGAIGIALQPVVDLHSGRCVSMEALARFDGALGTPDVVFAAAERVGLRLDLETAAVAKAVGLQPMLADSQSLAVNLSPDVAFALADRAEPDRQLDRLILEITEHAVVDNYTMIRERLAPLRERGLRLAIDDAGAGYASLRHIVELQPDIIKIDRSLVEGIHTDLGRRSALITFVLLALDLDATVVAEGIETQAELETVTLLGVDAGQGYFIARPSSDPHDVARWAHAESLL